MDLDELTDKVVNGTWADRVAAIRSVPNEFAGKEHQTVYAHVAGAFYAQHLAPTFHFVPWPDKFTDRQGFFDAYESAARATDHFQSTDPAKIAGAIEADPRSLRVFRLMAGYTVAELAATAKALAGLTLGAGTIERLESGASATAKTKTALPALAKLLTDIIAGTGGFTVSSALQAQGFRGKTDKPDTERGWDSVRDFHQQGVPYAELLYQRFYGGAFRQLQDAGGSRKGDILEDATEAFFQSQKVPYVRTVPGTQATAAVPFGITVQPAPDFILHDGAGRARGLLECKSAADGGTARDKAGRFNTLRTEANRLGGIPVLAVLEGLGWRRLRDTLGPVVRACDGRVFSLTNLPGMAGVDPVRDLIGLAP